MPSARRRFRAQVSSWQCAADAAQPASKLLQQSRGVDPHELWTNHVRRQLEQGFDPELTCLGLVLDYVDAGRPLGRLSNHDLRVMVMVGLGRWRATSGGALCYRRSRNCSAVSPASRTIPPSGKALTGSCRGIVRTRVPFDMTMCLP